MLCSASKYAKLDPTSSTSYYAIGGLFNVRERSNDGPFSCGTDLNPMGVALSQVGLLEFTLEKNEGFS